MFLSKGGHLANYIKTTELSEFSFWATFSNINGGFPNGETGEF